MSRIAISWMIPESARLALNRSRFWVEQRFSAALEPGLVVGFGR
jgi:hypothetical protein